MHDLRTSEVVAENFWKNLRQQDCHLTVWRWFNGFLSSLLSTIQQSRENFIISNGKQYMMVNRE